MTGRETRAPSQQQGLPSEPVWLNVILVQQKSSLSLYMNERCRLQLHKEFREKKS
jgi:hypothetical protein